jgi:hypothetical protein
MGKYNQSRWKHRDCFPMTVTIGDNYCSTILIIISIDYIDIHTKLSQVIPLQNYGNILMLNDVLVLNVH